MADQVYNSIHTGQQIDAAVTWLQAHAADQICGGAVSGTTIAVPDNPTYWFAPAGTYTCGSETITISSGNLGIISYDGSQWSSISFYVGAVSIINDLITGGIDVALSAEMGKRLREMIDNTTAVDLSDYTTAQAWLNNSGKWETNSNKYKGKFIPIPDDAEGITLAANSSYGNSYALLTTNTYSNGANVSFATGTSKMTTSAGETVKISTIPSDAKYLWTAVLNNNNDVTPQSVSFSYNIWEKINNLNVPVVINNLFTGGIDKALSAQQGVELKNLIIKYNDIYLSNYETIPYWLTANNIWKNYNSNQGKFIPIPDDVSCIKIVGHNNSGVTYQSVYALLTTDDHTVNSSVSYATGTGRYLLDKNATNEIIKIPNDAKYLWVGATAEYLNILPQSVSFGVNANDGLELLQSEIDSLNTLSNEDTLFLGNLVQQGYDASGLTGANSKCVTTESGMALPRESATLRFKFPDWLQCTIREGRAANNLNNLRSYFKNGDTFTFGSNMLWFRLSFMRTDTTADLSVADVTNAISEGKLKIFIEGHGSNIIDRNADNEHYIKAAMRPFVSGQNNNSGLHLYPVFAHTSDVHGDATRFNAMIDYCDYLGVDACLLSGDMVSKEVVDSMQFVNDVADAHSTLVLPCMGNHDARTLVTAETQYNTIMKHLMEKYSVSTNPNETYPTYFYKDFTNKKIRVISVNLYEGEHTHDNVNFTQEQCEWLISTLASTPQDYGVLLMFHSPDKLPAKDNNYAAFYQDIVVTTTTTMANITGNPFIQIVDAFIGKVSATISYSIGETSISVAADFTNLASGVEFIAFVNGHFHIDRIGYLPSTTHKQLNLNVTCGIAMYGGSSNAYYADCSDMPRGCTGSTQDCFNIYVIDRATKTVRVARVGSNVSGDLKERKFMVIPYAD